MSFFVLLTKLFVFDNPLPLETLSGASPIPPMVNGDYNNMIPLDKLTKCRKIREDANIIYELTEFEYKIR